MNEVINNLIRGDNRTRIAPALIKTINDQVQTEQTEMKKQEGQRYDK